MSQAEQLKDFLNSPGVKLIESREWSDGGIRSWLRLKKSRSPEEILELLEKLPVGAWLQFYDPDSPSASDQGAFVQIARHADRWSIGWSNYGWSSEHFTVPLSDAANYMALAYEVDWDHMLAKKSGNPQLVLHLTTAEKLWPIATGKLAECKLDFAGRLCPK